VIGLFFATVSLVFIYHLASFIVVEFWSGLLQYWRWTKYEFLIPIALFLEFTDRWMESEPDNPAKKLVRGLVTALWLVRTLLWLVMLNVVSLAFMVPWPLNLSADYGYLVVPVVYLLEQLIVLYHYLFQRKSKSGFFGYVVVFTISALLINRWVVPWVTVPLAKLLVPIIQAILG
jgi:hypothetical protein